MKVILTILVLIFSTQIYCQEFTNKKSLYLEIGGSAGIGSVNYENIFSEKGKINFLWRVGLSGLPIDKNNGFVVVIPATFGILFGQGSNKIELGIGQGVSITTKGNIFALTTPIIGYRYQNLTKRFFFRITYTPLISYIIDYQYQNWAGVSIGYNLNFNK